MADTKIETGTDNAAATGHPDPQNAKSAPELTEDQKRKLEAELRVDRRPAAETTSDEGHDDELEDSWKRPEPVVSDHTPWARRPATAGDDAAKGGGGRWQRFWTGYWRRKAWTLPLSLLLLLVLLAGVPYSRYAIASRFVSRTMRLTVNDQSTGKPVSSADITVGGKSGRTDGKGLVTLRGVKVGKQTVSVSKKYYRSADADVMVDLFRGADRQVSITATGRQVPVTVSNKLTGKGLAGVTLKAAGTESKTDKDGLATMVLPADKTELAITISADGYNSLDAKVAVTDQAVKANSFALTPAGKLYFLSRQSGKIDVVKTDLDGSNRQTVIAGTGKEDDRGTVLLASRDWKYLAFLSKRDSSPPKLYMIDTASDKLSVMDEGDASFSLVGWSNHDFAYNLTRNNVQASEANRLAVKTYDADKRQLLTTDQSAVDKDVRSGYDMFQSFNNFYLLGDKLFYTVDWNLLSGPYYYAGGPPQGRGTTVRVLTVGSVNKKDLKTFAYDQYNNVTSRLYESDELYVAAHPVSNTDNGQYEYYEYQNGDLQSARLDDQDDQNAFFDNSYPTHLYSPDGKRTFWNEQRDGRQTFFVGDADGKNEKQVTVLEDGQVYGWYGNDYLLMSKKGSELYIMPAAGGTPLKVADYHKPQLSYYGYGGGYGGL